ncbi:MAG: helix-turn-helix transcriptional regulator [Burkholderiaceae bacterium]
MRTARSLRAIHGRPSGRGRCGGHPRHAPRVRRYAAAGAPGRAWPARRQAELAWWLARGLPESRIAERMGISVNTVVYHRRQLYTRMGVVRRDELLAALGVARSAPWTKENPADRR